MIKKILSILCLAGLFYSASYAGQTKKTQKKAVNPKLKEINIVAAENIELIKQLGAQGKPTQITPPPTPKAEEQVKPPKKTEKKSPGKLQQQTIQQKKETERLKQGERSTLDRATKYVKDKYKDVKGYVKGKVQEFKDKYGSKSKK